MPTPEQARLWYPQDDPVHGFDHVLRVYRLAERLALAEGADLEIVRAAALLHDAADRQNGGEGDHHQAAAEFARRQLQAEGWSSERIAAVEHCIRAHRFRSRSEAPASLEAQVLFDADKLDAIGATGVWRALAYAWQHGQPAFAEPSPRFLASNQLEVGEAHSAYHEHLFKLSKLKDLLFTRTARSLAERRHQRMVEFFEQLLAEMRGET